MRWFWFDRYTEFVSGQRATAVKNVSLAEDHLHDHFPGVPVMPNSLIVEGMAQTAGLLVGESVGFVKRVILAKLPRVKFHCAATPGDTLTYRAEIHDNKEDGAMVTTTSHIGERLQAEAEIFFAKLDSNSTGGADLFRPERFMQWLTLVKLYDVARMPNGQAVPIPPELLPPYSA